MTKYNSKFFEWLNSTDKLNLWEALLDTIEDFSDLSQNIRANDEISKIKKEYQKFNIREERKKKLNKINEREVSK